MCAAGALISKACVENNPLHTAQFLRFTDKYLT